MEVVDLKVKTTKSLVLPMQETTLMPIGDLHYENGRDDQACNITAFRRHLDYGMKIGAYFVGMGDMVEVMSPSNRRALLTGKFHDSVVTSVDESAEKGLEGLKSELKGTQGQWLGLVEGHHFYEFPDGTTSDTRLCQFLKAPFLGTCGNLGLKMVAQGKQRVVCDVVVHHGTGSSRSLSGSVSFLEKMPVFFPQADIILMGHRHICLGLKALGGIYTNWNVKPPLVSHRERVLGYTGSFLRAYMQGSTQRGRPGGTYVERALLPPSTLGGLVIRIRPVQRKGHYHLSFMVEQ